jgi:glycosyltransferase involved in cell wall biosynthesis
MKTIFVITSLDRGGAEKQFMGIVNFLRDQEDIYVITMFKSPANSNFAVDFHLDMNRFLPSPIKILRFIFFIFKLDPKIIVSFNFPALVLVKLSKILPYRFTHVISERNEYLGGFFKRFFRKYFTPRNTIFNVNSLSTAYNLENFKIASYDLVSYIPNWIELPNSVRKYNNRSQLKWLFVGRLIKQKNIFFILSLFKEMTLQYPKIELWIIGGGKLERHMHAYILRNKLENNVFFLGNRVDLEPIYLEFNYLILASLHEGSANVLLESISHGLIPISSRVGSCNELFLNQEFLIVDDFSIEKFSRIISNVMTLSSEDFASLQGQLFDNLSRFHTINSVGNKWVELINHIKTKNQV